MRRPWPRLRLALPLLLPILAGACAAGPAAHHFVLEGTDGAFDVKVIGAGPEELCRGEVLRVAREELRRRRAAAPVIHEQRMLLLDHEQEGRRSCLAELNVSTLPPWN